MKIKRKLNQDGYVLVYMPDHPRAYKKGGYKGWAYEHILVAERKLNRIIKHYEMVHHLDLRRSNNSPENLLVCTDEQHQAIHAWIESGMPFKGRSLLNSPGRFMIRLGNRHSSSTKEVKIKRCENCDFPVAKNFRYCSPKCSRVGSRLLNRPSLEEIVELVKVNSWVSVGKIFNVSDNAVRKWVIQYGADPKSLR